MSTQAIIRFCDKRNNEVGAIVLHMDGYPATVRDILLKKLAAEFSGNDAEDAMMDLPYIC